MRARAVSAAVSATVLVTGLLTAIVGESASAVAPVGSRYTAVSPTRVLDTRSGIGVKKTRVASGKTVTFDVSSVVPSTATSVVLNLTVAGETAPGFVTAYGDGTATPGVSNLNYVRAQTVPNLAVVTFGGSKKVTLYNSGGTVDLLADVSGYYLPASAVSTPPTATDQGSFVGVTPSRLVDTRTSKTPIAAKTSRPFSVGDLPVDASAVLVNVTETGARERGFLTAYSGDSTSVPGTSTVNFPAGRTVPNLALVPLGTGNRVKVYNGSTGSTNVLLDVQGYVVNGDPTVAGGTGVLRPTRVLAAHAIASKKTYPLKVAGAGGVPLTGVAAAVLNVTVTRPTGGGFLSVSASTARPSFSNLNFAAGQTVANLVQAPVDSTGTTTFYNGSSGTVYVLADVLGYVPSSTVTAPPATTSRYLADLTGDATDDAATMKAHACADAKAGTDFVLLDVGAQSRRTPLTNGGVALALSRSAADPKQPVRLTYAQLVDAVAAYADGFTTACGAAASARIAVGTSNSGNFTDKSDPTNPVYPAGSRGTDWFNRVVKPLQAQVPDGVTIVGANDIENGDPNEDGFDDNVENAQSWETSWFAATSTTLVFNGSANGCPSTYGGTGSCNDGWTQAQFYGLARGTGKGAGKVQVLPQIYYSTQAIQWANIDRAGGSGLTFVGALTQYALDSATFTPSAGWAALRHALSTYRTPPTTLRSVDLTYGTAQDGAASTRDLERSRGDA